MKEHSQKGFALLLSILVISMILSVALGITSIVIKENQLSALVQESEAAFHAADKGIDCALFYHISYDRNTPALLWSPFPTSTVGAGYSYPSNMNSVTCDGEQLNTGWSVTNPAAGTWRTSFRLDFIDGSCVDVRVENSNGGVNAVVTAEGYNTCDTTSPRRTLRVIEVRTTL